MNTKPKHYYVPWDGYSRGSSLDTLCLQGPHDRETAHQIASEIRSAGFKASVIDVSETLKARDALATAAAEFLIWWREYQGAQAYAECLEGSPALRALVDAIERSGV